MALKLAVDIAPDAQQLFNVVRVLLHDLHHYFA